MEALLAVALLAISLTVIVQGITAAYRASRMGWRYSEAALALDNATVERIFQGGIAAGTEEDGNLDKPFGFYQYQLVSRAAVVNGAPNKRLNEASISASWKEGVKAHSVDLQTFLFNTSPSDDDSGSP